MATFDISFRQVLSRIFFLSAVLIFTIGANAQQKININEPGAVPMTEVGADQMKNNPLLKNAKRARPFRLNSLIRNQRGLNTGDELQLQLFNNKNFESVVQTKSTDINGVTTVVLKLQEYEHAYGYLTLSNGSYLLTINIPALNEKYSTRMSKGNSDAYLIEVDKSTLEGPDCSSLDSEMEKTSSDLQKSQDLTRTVESSENLSYITVYFRSCGY